MKAASRVDYEPSTKSLLITLTVISLLYESLFLDSLSLECWHFFLIIKVPILTNRVPLLNHGWSKDGFFFVQLWMCTITLFTANKAYTQLWVKLTWEFFFFFFGFYLWEMNMCPDNRNDVIFMIDKDNKGHFTPIHRNSSIPFF